MAASPWPMPEVSTTIRSNPVTLQAAITSGRARLISEPKSRVAKLRIKTRCPLSAWSACVVHGEIAFMRMRSPSKAPPLLRREGSMEITAMRKLSAQSKRKRRISSSVKEDLPAPPVPVIPIVGIFLPTALARMSCSKPALSCFPSMAVSSCANARQWASECPSMAERACGAKPEISLSQRITISPIIPASPIFCPSSGL